METYNSIELTKQLVKDGKISQEIAETIFPELKESEDERIRKILIDAFTKKNCSQVDELVDCRLTSGEIIEWLEKQGSQNLANSAKTCKVEQNPAWSEEDEENLNWFEKFFRAESVVAEGRDIPQDRYLWFKNLKERVQPQNTWKPSDEQMEALIKKACDFFEENIEEEDCKFGSSEWTELRAEYKSLDSFIRAFRNYMKGE